MHSKKIITLFYVLRLWVNKITIDEMYNGTFRAKGMDELQSLKIQINTRS
jgi:dipeptidyl-peptidase-4